MNIRKPGEETFYASSLLPLPRLSRRRRRLAPGYVPRPANSFILFRKDAVQRFKDSETESNDAGTKRRQAEMSKEISRQWKALSREERAEWDRKAAQIKTEHEQEFPNYSYRPNRRPRPVTFPAPAPSYADSDGGISSPSTTTATTPNDLQISLPPTVASHHDHDAFRSPNFAYNSQWILPSSDEPSSNIRSAYDSEPLNVSYSDNLYDDRWYMGEEHPGANFIKSPVPLNPQRNVVDSFEGATPVAESPSWSRTFHQPLAHENTDSSEQHFRPRVSIQRPTYPPVFEQPAHGYSDAAAYLSPSGDVDRSPRSFASYHVPQPNNSIVSPTSSPNQPFLDSNLPEYSKHQEERADSSGSEWGTSESGITNEEWLSMVDALSLEYPAGFTSPVQGSPSAITYSPQSLAHQNSDSTITHAPTDSW